MCKIISLMLLLCAGMVQASEHDELNTLYRIQLYRAAPGALLEFIAINQSLEEQGFYRDWSPRAPFMARHSQGDQWDIMLIQPMLSYGAYFTTDKIRLRRAAHEKFAAPLSRLEAITSFKEDLFAAGPALERLEREFKQKDFLHIEIFYALAGKKDELIAQRRMENEYLKGVKRRPNELFVVDGGGDADVITIGFYDSLQDFAKPHDLDSSARDAVAKRAGFKGLDDISPYLRSLISAHHDTLAGVVR